ncbi:hypothetical protein like AT2G34320 [Hibiscus trionum]|uniref:RNase H type-1 domain-containing protein n=1 Tax=Hibiscus trionum TaxID=183268 RepID=A0A9W7HIZ8_HIBTR|nr:hypothetical protein like AT2G34320 [Hibiscus trionum]
MEMLVELWDNLSNHDHANWWIVVPFAVLWMVWLMRNDIIFKGKNMDETQLIFLVRYRLAWWIRSKSRDEEISVESLTADMRLASILWKAKIKVRTMLKWEPPPLEFLKMNVDGASLVEKTGCGIGGVMRDHSGMELVKFSEASEINPPAITELLAINRGNDIFMASTWACRSRLIVESDCAQVVDWVVGRKVAPIVWGPVVNRLRGVISSKGILIRLIPKCCNMEADRLAKTGIS